MKSGSLPTKIREEPKYLIVSIGEYDVTKFSSKYFYYTSSDRHEDL